MRSVAALTALLFLLLALAPLATADHAYSHRYIVYGRVIDKEGFPVQGLSVSARIEGQLTEPGGCSATHPPVTQSTTDSKGDYFYCFHTHRIGSSTGKAIVTAANSTKTVSLDVDLRKARVDFELDQSRPTQRGNLAQFNRTYSLWTTLWKPGETAIEGITVEGTALTDRKLTARVEYNGGKILTGNATTNDYGDAQFTFTFPEDFVSGSVTVDGPKGESRSAALDAKFHASTIVIQYAGEPWWKTPGVLSFVIIGAVIVAGAIAYGVWRFSKGREPTGRRGRR